MRTLWGNLSQVSDVKAWKVSSDWMYYQRWWRNSRRTLHVWALLTSLRILVSICRSIRHSRGGRPRRSSIFFSLRILSVYQDTERRSKIMLRFIHACLSNISRKVFLWQLVKITWQEWILTPPAATPQIYSFFSALLLEEYPQLVSYQASVARCWFSKKLHLTGSRPAKIKSLRWLVSITLANVNTNKYLSNTQ